MAIARSYHASAAAVRASDGAASPRLVAAHHAAQSRAEARDRRIRDEDLALDGRPRLHGGNCRPVRPTARTWR